MGWCPGLGAGGLKARMLELLKEDEEFRLAVAGLIGLEEVLRAIRSLQEQVAQNGEAILALQRQVADNREAILTLQRQMAENREAILALQKQVAENREAILALQKQVVENREAILALQRQMAENREAILVLQKQVVENTAAIRELREDMNKEFELLRRYIDALGARWGLLAEDTFRAGMVGVVERYFKGRVERWTYRDEGGHVFGRPSMVEADLVITDREHILMEIKSSASRADIFKLWRIGQLYERVVGVKPKLVIVSPYVREEAKEEAKELEIEVFTSISI